jgi:hypothetical protein
MATRQYNTTRRTQATGLADVIRNLISGTTPYNLRQPQRVSQNYQRRPQRVSQRTIDNMDDLKQNFDPSNIGRALGRKTAGMFINLFKGKDKEDRVKGRRARAKEVNDNKKNNPLYTKISEGTDKPVRKNDSLSDVFSKIYNLLKLNTEDNRKKNQLEKNFGKEKEDEREKRHLELVKAISGLTGGGTVTKVREKEKGNFFGDLLNSVKRMIEDFKKLLGPLLDFTKMIGKAGFKSLTSFLSLLGTSGMLAFLLPAAAAAALLWLANETKKEIEANPDDPKFKNNPYAMSLRGEAKSVAAAGKRNANEVRLQVPRNQVEEVVKANLPQEDYVREFGATKEVLQSWLDKSKDEKGAAWQKPVKNEQGQIITKAGPVGSNLRVSAAQLSGQTTATARTSGSAPGASSSISPSYFKEPPKLQETATPTPPAPDRSSKRVQAAIAEQFYQDEVAAAKRSVTINSPKTVVGGDTKVQSLNVEESAPVRIDDPTLKHIQERNLRRF